LPAEAHPADGGIRPEVVLRMPLPQDGAPPEDGSAGTVSAEPMGKLLDPFRLTYHAFAHRMVNRGCGRMFLGGAMTEAVPGLQEKLRDAIREKQLKDAQRPKTPRLPWLDLAKIIGLCIAMSVLYGVVHDQITARLCIEYFTVGHPPLVKTSSPTLLALCWGVVASWWVGLILGVPLAFICLHGSRPKLRAAQLLRPILLLLLLMAAASLVFGAIGYYRAKAGHMWLRPPLATRIPPEKHDLYLADLWAHAAAYCIGFFGGVVIWFSAWSRRRRLATEPAQPPRVLPGDEISRN